MTAHGGANDVYTWWEDFNPKTPVTKKIDAAASLFREKFGRDPRFCLCSTLDAEASEGRCLPRPYIRKRGVFYVGPNPPSPFGHGA